MTNSLSSGGPASPGTDDAPRPAGSPRGAQRRNGLLRAGLELLAEEGWSGLTARAVAARAGTHQGSVHYHFGGLAELKRAVAAAAVREAFEPVLSVLSAASSWPAGLAAAVRSAADHGEPRTARITAELVAASVRDPVVGELVRQALADARARLVPWLSATGEAEPEGLATLLVATLDGLVLHRLLDPALDLGHVAGAADDLAGRARRPTPGRGE